MTYNFMLISKGRPRHARAQTIAEAFKKFQKLAAKNDISGWMHVFVCIGGTSFTCGQFYRHCTNAGGAIDNTSQHSESKVNEMYRQTVFPITE